MEVAPAVQIEFDSPAEGYIPWLQNIGPGCDYIIERLRTGDTLAFAEVIQQYLFDNPALGERLHDGVEEGLEDGTLLEDCELPPEALEYVENFWSQPTVFIKFMDTMEEAGVDYSHGIVLRAEDLADYSQEIEEIAMTLKSIEENVKALADALQGPQGLNARMTGVEVRLGAVEQAVKDAETRVSSNLTSSETRLTESIEKRPTKEYLIVVAVVAFLAGLGSLHWDTVLKILHVG